MMDSPWFTTYSHVNDAALRLFCFHYAGGSSNVFRTWPVQLPEEIEIIGVELPGHGRRLSETCRTDLLSLVRDITAEMSAFLDLPFAFFGHSMGALLSFEIAHLLRRFNMPMPEHLLLSAHKAPHLPRESEPMHALPEQEFIRRLVEMNGTPKAVLENRELKSLFIPLLRSDFEVCEKYRFSESIPLACPITVFGGRDDNEVSQHGLRAWEKHTTAAFHMHMCDGDHFFINSPERSLFPLLSPLLKSIITQNATDLV